MAEYEPSPEKVPTPLEVGGVAAHLLRMRLNRDLDVLTGAGMLMETVPDAAFTGAMLRLIVQHAQNAAETARTMLLNLPQPGPDRGSS
jgi:hypothetical protein